MKTIKILIILTIIFFGITVSSFSEPKSPMVFGDLNSDNVIDYDDFYIVLNDSYAYVTGSTLTDLNGDGFTNLWML